MASALHDAWATRPGVWGWLTAVNHKQIGMRFIVTGLGFLVVGGILAMLIRTQLAVPGNEVLGAEGYNRAVTLHGTTMMFLFAVPVVEGLGMYLLPLMLGTRDLPFPRLNAFGYWTYLFGGLFLYAGLLVGEVPDAGWFAYVPLSGPEFSPDQGMDFWLLGVTFVEISAIVGAAELIVLFLKRRAPGMSLNRIPVFGWSIVTTSAMILLAFPALVTASVLLEVERAFGTRFYDPGSGGDPLLWQHLFWIFGHPEVYIMFLPAAGVVSMILPTFSRRTIAGYTWVIAATLAVGVISFGLWAHHMFAVGLPVAAIGMFAAASLIITIPNGVQFFAWIATLWNGRPRLGVPMLFVLGFLAIFLLGGITGVMVAAAPFDLQVHDSFFVVAHFHYVLVGGVVFPIFAGLYYWFPKWSGRLLSERLGRLSFWSMFIGFNVAFFPQHALGLQGMPRRIFTYPSVEGWGLNNLVSTVGAYLLAAGVLVTIVAVVRGLRRGAPAGDDPWESGSLEWAAASPPRPYNFERLPVVRGLDPLWADPVEPGDATARVVEELRSPAHGAREVLQTRAGSAAVEQVVVIPGPSGWPLISALAAVVALLGALLGSGWLIAAGLGATVASLLAWAVDTAAVARAAQPVRRSLPVQRSGSGAWGMGLGALSLASILASLVFAYVLIWLDADRWPLDPGAAAPSIPLPLVATVAAALAAAAALVARRRVLDAARGATALLAAALALTAAFAAVAYVWVRGIDAAPTADAYGSVAVALVAFCLIVAIGLLVVLAFAAWQSVSGRLTRGDDAAVSVAAILAAFLAAAWLLVAALLLVAPRLG